MIPLNLRPILIISLVFLSFFLPLPGAESASLEKPSITIDRKDKPIGEILEEIEKQTDYTFKILDFGKAETLDEVMSNKKSLVLKQASLDQAFSRLFKDYNYSVISDEKNKTLTLVLMNKDNKGSTPTLASGSNEQGNPEEDSMDAVTVAFAEYYKGGNPGKQAAINPEDQEETTMDGATSAFEEYNTNMQDGAFPNTELVEQEETTMDAVTAAFEEYQTNSQNETMVDTDSMGSQEETTMDAVSKAFAEYNTNRQGNAPLHTGQIEQEATTMDAVTEAFNEYNRLNSRK